MNEILRDEGLTFEEMKEALWKRNVSFVKAYDRYYNMLFIPLAILWLLPAVAEYSGWSLLALFAGLRRIDFPSIAVVLAVVLFLIGICLEAIVCLERIRHGGCHDFHESVVVIRQGPYRIIRHPGYLAEIIYFAMFPIILGKWVPYTIFAGVGTILVVASLSYLIRAEDDFNVKKWGEEYRRYMKEVPAINFVEGLRNLKQSNECESGREVD